MAGAITLGIFPLALLALAMIESEHESILGMNGLLFGVIIIAAGILGYTATKKFRHPTAAVPAIPTEHLATGD
jgi:UDP-N-acetylmuramyl pentapeptide phosphotransferase/UDP-N-acetylglucosamine-1-phosphate transferase